MSKSNHFDEIEAYLTGQMSEAKRQIFEQRLSKEKDLAMEFELQKLEHQSMNVLIEQDLRSSITSWADAPPVNPFGEEDAKKSIVDNPNKPPAKVVPIGASRRRLLWMAASIAVLILTAIGVSRYLAQDPSTAENNIAIQGFPIPIEPPDTTTTTNPKPGPVIPKPPKKISPPPKDYGLLAIAAYDDRQTAFPKFAPQLRTGDAKTDSSAVVQAAEAFDSDDYQKAIDFLGSPKSGDQSHVRYLRGHTYFRLKDYEKAIPEFAFLVANELVPKHEESRWYLLLSYLAEYEKYKEAFEKLGQELANDPYSTTYKDRVAKLLSEVQ
ncbi:MAG: hypothetical protein HRU41_35060 [Saprospiraceae bacterium]|nr:hypothetical protein [Saprospiraceae bacterium]